MAKKKTPTDGAEPTSSPKVEKVTTTKIFESLLSKARRVAEQRGIALFDYLNESLSPVVENDYKSMIEDEYKKLHDKGK